MNGADTMGTTPQLEAEADYLEAETGEAAHLAAPLDVRVTEAVQVQEYPPRTITTDQLPVGAAAVRIASAHRLRARLRIRAGAVDVYVGSAGVTPGTGYLLPAGQVLDLEASAELHAVTAGGAGTVYLLAEHREG